MFFKPDQNNVSEARDAVKKQLLRSLIQQVVDELGTADSVDLDADMAAILSEDSFRTSMDSLRAAVSEGVQRHLYDGLISEVVSDFDLSTQNTESYVAAALAQADLSSFKEVIHAQTMKRLHDEVLPSIIEDESTAVASFEATEDEAAALVDEAIRSVDAAVLRRQVQAMIAERLESDIVPSIVQDESNALATSDLTELHDCIQREVLSPDMDDVIAQVTTRVEDSLNGRIEEAMSNTVSGVERAIEEITSSYVQERLKDLMESDEWKKTLSDAEEVFSTAIVTSIEESVTSETAFAERIDQAIDTRITANVDFMSKLEQEAKYRLVRVLAQDVMAKIDRDDYLKNDVVREVSSNDEVINPVVETVTDRVFKHIVSSAMERFDEAENAADVAMSHIDTEQPSVLRIVDALEEMLSIHVSEQVVTRLADQDHMAKMSDSWITAEGEVVESAVASVLGHITSVIRDRVILEASQTETIVGNVLPSFTAETDEVRAAIRETRNRLIDRVVNLTLRELENPAHVAAEVDKRVADENERLLNAVASSVELLVERVSTAACRQLDESDEVATKASSAVAGDAPEFNRAIEAAMALVQQEVASRVQERMVATDSVSSEARALLGAEPKEVQKAAALLERSLLQEVADGTKEQLHDVHAAAERARTFLRATNEIDAVKEAMRVRLFKSMAETVMGQLSDTDKVSTEAFWHLDQQHEHVRNAMSELRRQMLFTIAKETMASLADTEAVANESHDLVPASSGPMTAAAEALKDRLVSDVAREALELMKDTDSVVAQANAQMGDHEDVLRALQGIVERHLMESLLASALSQIGTQVSGMDDAAERSFLRRAVSEIQGAQAGSVPVGLKPTEQAPNTTSAGVKPEGQAWSRLSDLSGNEDAAPAPKKWRINEFRPEDWDALPGAASDSKRTRVRAFPKGE